MADEPELEVEELEPEVAEPEEAEAEPEVTQPEVQEPEEQPELQVQPSRANTRIQTLSEEARAAKAELAETRRRLDEITARISQPAQETPEQRAQRFALMTPQEQMSETLRDSEKRMAAQLQTMQMQTADSVDRTAFQVKAQVDPLYAKWAPKVEGKLAELRSQGNSPNRETILKYLIGEAALEGRGKQGKTQAAQAARRVVNAKTRPTNSGSDAQAQRTRTASLERRLENVEI